VSSVDTGPHLGTGEPKRGNPKSKEKKTPVGFVAGRLSKGANDSLEKKRTRSWTSAPGAERKKGRAWKKGVPLKENYWSLGGRKGAWDPGSKTERK